MEYELNSIEVFEAIQRSDKILALLRSNFETEANYNDQGRLSEEACEFILNELGNSDTVLKNYHILDEGVDYTVIVHGWNNSLFWFEMLGEYESNFYLSFYTAHIAAVTYIHQKIPEHLFEILNKSWAEISENPPKTYVRGTEIRVNSKPVLVSILLSTDRAKPHKFLFIQRAYTKIFRLFIVSEYPLYNRPSYFLEKGTPHDATPIEIKVGRPFDDERLSLWLTITGFNQTETILKLNYIMEV